MRTWQTTAYNCSVVPEPDPDFQFPSGVSYIVVSRRQTSTLPWTGLIRLKLAVGNTRNEEKS
jgi:hypothetical protein